MSPHSRPGGVSAVPCHFCCWGQSGAWSICFLLRLEGWGQVPGVAALPPALSFPVLLLLHHVWENDGEDPVRPIFLGTHCIYGLLWGCSDWQKPSKTTVHSFMSTSIRANQKAGSHWHKEWIWGGCRKRGSGEMTKSFDLSACFLNMRLKTHLRFGVFKGRFLQKFGQKDPRLDSEVVLLSSRPQVCTGTCVSCGVCECVLDYCFFTQLYLFC